jgi:hypothetical protein
MFEVSIPSFSDSELEKRYEQVKPIVKVDDKLYYLRDYSIAEFSTFSYLSYIDDDIREEVCENDLVSLNDLDFACLYDTRNQTPTIGEILSQIDRKFLPLVKAFEVIEYPKTINDFYKNSMTTIAFQNGFYVATVRLYG